MSIRNFLTMQIECSKKDEFGIHRTHNSEFNFLKSLNT